MVTLMLSCHWFKAKLIQDNQNCQPSGFVQYSVRNVLSTVPHFLCTGKLRMSDAAQWSKEFGASTKLHSDESEVAGKFYEQQLLLHCFEAPSAVFTTLRASSPQPPKTEDTQKQVSRTYPRAHFKPTSNANVHARLAWIRKSSWKQQQ